MTHPNPTCETCRWWDVADDDVARAVKEESSGRCRRHPPVLNHTVVYLMSQDESNPDSCQLDDAENEADRWTAWKFPSTQYDDFCGEHSPRIPLPMAKERHVVQSFLEPDITFQSILFENDAEGHLPMKVWNALEKQGITTIGQLIGHSHKQVLSMPIIGKVSMDHLLRFVKFYGVDWPSAGVKGMQNE